LKEFAVYTEQYPHIFLYFVNILLFTLTAERK